jgi:hypothetical protein
MASMSDPVITVTATVQHGTVIRWYRSIEAAEDRGPALSASRMGVMVHREYLTDIPAEWIDRAREAHAVLAADRNADLDSWATYSRHGLFGPLKVVMP